MKAKYTPVVIPPELRDKVSSVKNRILFLSPSVEHGEERECRKEDFESLASSNIGVGGFGKVYKVRHKASKNVYAIKVINKAKIMEHDLIEQIKLEVKIMYNLNHDNIVKLHNHYEDEDNFYLILEYCGKGQLYTMLKRDGRLNERLAAQYLREIICAVSYLHNHEPPIIHRDIKPENILLDAEGTVKLADFGWSNFFNEDRRRLTYCGTPEYLAPEMIKQSGHDKSLDIWNLGVLMFELLTGSPPFEGSNQNALFENILKFKIKWPKGFSGIARDLVTKLLKINPQERIPLDQVLNHPWFKSLEPMKPLPAMPVAQEPKQIDLNASVKKEDYMVVSKPSLQNKQANQAESMSKAAKDMAAGMKDLKDQQIEQLQQQVLKLQKELENVKQAHQEQVQGLESTISELKESNLQISSKSQSTRNSIELKKIMDENQKLKALAKSKDEILKEMETKSKNLREKENMLRLTQKDVEIQESQMLQQQEIQNELIDKIKNLEKRERDLKDQVQELEREKEDIQLDAQNKIQVLQYKLLNKMDSENTVEDNSEGSFKELLSMCRQDLQEIFLKINQAVKTDLTEDSMREELLQSSQKVQQTRSLQEQLLYEKEQEAQKKQAKLREQLEALRKQEEKKYQDELAVKNERIKELERNEMRKAAEKELSQSLQLQLKQAQELCQTLKAEKDLAAQDRQYLEDAVKKAKEQLKR